MCFSRECGCDLIRFDWQRFGNTSRASIQILTKTQKSSWMKDTDWLELKVEASLQIWKVNVFFRRGECMKSIGQCALGHSITKHWPPVLLRICWQKNSGLHFHQLSLKSEISCDPTTWGRNKCWSIIDFHILTLNIKGHCAVWTFFSSTTRLHCHSDSPNLLPQRDTSGSAAQRGRHWLNQMQHPLLFHQSRASFSMS